MSTLPTRRRIVAALGAIAAGPLAGSQSQRPGMEQKPSTALNETRTSIPYEIDFKPSPQRLYEAILDQKQFAAFPRMPATIDPMPDGAFSM